MQRKFLTAIAFTVLCVMTLAIAVNSGRAQRTGFESPQRPQQLNVQPSRAPVKFSRLQSTPAIAPTVKAPTVKAPTVKAPTVKAPRSPVKPTRLSQSAPTDCALQAGVRSSAASRSAPENSLLTLSRFRLQSVSDNPQLPSTKQSVSNYTPREAVVPIDPTNFGDRFLRDINGNPANLQPIVVLHETVAPLSSTINFFRTPHSREADQASYHTLIAWDGTIVYMVPPDKRAYGAGNSVFNGRNGLEAVKTHAKFSPSVNNFAYHVSLETPPDGYNNAQRHGGYTNVQYQSLAWLVAKTGIPDDRITTHKAVDRSASRMDPRSFNFSHFFQLLQGYTKTNEIVVRCTVPPAALQTKRPVRQVRKQTKQQKSSLAL